MGPKKIPMRMCVGCRERKPKRELIRIVRNKDEEVFVDGTGKASGRGAYICKDGGCLKNAIKTNALSRMLEANIDESIFEKLESQISSCK